jgi:hypothetical protein
MTTIHVQAPLLALDPATRSTLLQTVIDTIPYIPNSSETEKAAERDSAFALVAALDPRDPVQAMLVAQLVAAHHAAIHAYRCAALPGVPPALHLRYQGRATVLSRLAGTRLRELRRLQDAALKAAARATAAGPRATQAPATSSGGQVRAAAPAARPWFAAAGQRRGSAAPAKAATGAEAVPSVEVREQLLKQLTARLAADGIAMAA